MAPIGTVIKNGLVYVILAAPLVWVGARFIILGFINALYTFTNDDGTIEPSNSTSLPHADFFNSAVFNLAMGLFFAFVIPGVVYMKSLSDSVEEGMVEF